MTDTSGNTSTDTAPERAVSTVEQLEEEGDVAADYLEGLLDISDIDGDLAGDPYQTYLYNCSKTIESCSKKIY
jgi:spoIIIJ-associated protein